MSLFCDSYSTIPFFQKLPSDVLRQACCKHLSVREVDEAVRAPRTLSLALCLSLSLSLSWRRAISAVASASPT
jgi:hypothetical protein